MIRGCNPAPGAWTTLEGKELQLFDARKHPVRTFGAVKGKIGEVVEVTDKSFQVSAQGGRIEVLRAKLGEGKKLAAGMVELTRRRDRQTVDVPVGETAAAVAARLRE